MIHDTVSSMGGWANFVRYVNVERLNEAKAHRELELKLKQSETRLIIAYDTFRDMANGLHDGEMLEPLAELVLERIMEVKTGD